MLVDVNTLEVSQRQAQRNDLNFLDLQKYCIPERRERNWQWSVNETWNTAKFPDVCKTLLLMKHLQQKIKFWPPGSSKTNCDIEKSSNRRCSQQSGMLPVWCSLRTAGLQLAVTPEQCLQGGADVSRCCLEVPEALTTSGKDVGFLSKVCSLLL